MSWPYQLLKRLWRYFRQSSVLEKILWVIAVAVMFALLIPEVKWASSGENNVPVRVLVFDAETFSPIPGAEAVLFRAAPWEDNAAFFEQLRERSGNSSVSESRGKTDPSGQVVIKYNFRTGANHERPKPHAHTNWTWASVRAEGYGAVVIPVRHESMPTAQMKELKELRLPVGLIRNKAK